jgi:hypothetical protein
MSDDEEDSLHYHHNNRIEASEITNDDFVYFTHSYSEEDPSSELGWESRADSSRKGENSDDDWVPQASAQHVTMMAHKRGKAKDTRHDSVGEESTSRQRKYAKANENIQESRDNKKAPKTFIKSARRFLKNRFEANHTGEPGYSLDQNTVINLAYFNYYAKANKLKVKASKKIKKLLAGMDENNSRKVNSSQLIKSNKSADEDVGYNSSEKPKQKCTKCGNLDTTPQKNARPRIMTTSPPDQRKQIWRLVVNSC